MVPASFCPPMKATWRGDSRRRRLASFALRPILTSPRSANCPGIGRGNLSDSALPWQADLDARLTARPGLPEDALPFGVLPLRSDLIIRHAQVIDGSGGPRFRADVAVEGDRIRAVGDLGAAEAEVTIDGTGCILAPGLIDVHTHDDRAPIDDREHRCKTSQGV